MHVRVAAILCFLSLGFAGCSGGGGGGSTMPSRPTSPTSPTTVLAGSQYSAIVLPTPQPPAAAGDTCVGNSVGINDNADVVEALNCTSPNIYDTTAIYAGASITYLQSYQQGTSINSHDEVAGRYSDGSARAFIFSSGTSTDVPAFQQTHVLPDGTVIGTDTRTATFMLARATPSGTVTDIGPGQVLDVNANGDIAYASLPSYHVYLRKADGTVVDLESVTHQYVSSASVAVNDKDQVAFTVANGSNNVPMFYDGTTTTAIPLLPGDTSAVIDGINDNGEVIGWSKPGGHVFIYHAGKTTDLQSVIPASVKVEPAFENSAPPGELAINNKNQIAAIIAGSNGQVAIITPNASCNI